MPNLLHQKILHNFEIFRNIHVICVTSDFGYSIRTLPRGGMYWEIHPRRPERFTKGVNFAPRGPRDFPRAKPEGNLEGQGVQNPRPREDVPQYSP